MLFSGVPIAISENKRVSTNKLEIESFGAIVKTEGSVLQVMKTNSPTNPDTLVINSGLRTYIIEPLGPTLVFCPHVLEDDTYPIPPLSFYSQISCYAPYVGEGKFRVISKDPEEYQSGDFAALIDEVSYPLISQDRYQYASFDLPVFPGLQGKQVVLTLDGEVITDPSIFEDPSYKWFMVSAPEWNVRRLGIKDDLTLTVVDPLPAGTYQLEMVDRGVTVVDPLVLESPDLVFTLGSYPPGFSVSLALWRVLRDEEPITRWCIGLGFD